MKRIDLGGTWTLSGGGLTCTGKIPGSVYSFLLDAGLMEEPYYRENEDRALELMKEHYTFTRTFFYSPTESPVRLCCEGLDTLAKIELNGKAVGETVNMHRRYEFDVSGALCEGENVLSVSFASPTRYVETMHAADPFFAISHPYEGFYQLRKAHCSFGWDWGPRLPDAGIWRDIYLLVENSARIIETRILQRHENGRVWITPKAKVSRPCELTAIVTAPDGTEYEIPCGEESEIPSPRLWWPNGLGDQVLYTVTFTASEQGKAVDSVTKRIGLRTLKLIQERDEYGRGMWHEVNGVAYFAMGANYIPEDNVLSRISKERSRVLLRQAKICNFNTLRIWGGGYYPDDWFYDLCDEMGLVIFQDVMVACCMPPDRREIRDEIEAEVRDNLLRFRDHACLGTLAGNNEVESIYANRAKRDPDLLPDHMRENYLEIFEKIIPRVIDEICPEIPYIPSSPTTGGHFIDPQNENYGDAHFWGVWHQNLPYDEYRKHYFRYLSEFGFQSYPCEKTVHSFTLPEDRNPFSRVMERHQRRTADNAKVFSYLAQTFLYPTSFPLILFASQVMQATAMKYCVEHLRRNRGRCMGALYWQFNDIWPGTSWSGIDYFGRYKVLQYVAKRFFAPVMISCEEVGETATRKDVNAQKHIFDFETTAALCVHNDTREEFRGTVHWSLRDADSKVLESGSREVTVPPTSVLKLEKMDFCKTDVRKNHLSFYLESEGAKVSEGSVLFTAPKHYEFADPCLTCTVKGDEITVSAKAFAQCVQIDSEDSDFILSDNCFDMEQGEKTVKILEGEAKSIRLRCVYHIR